MNGSASFRRLGDGYLGVWAKFHENHRWRALAGSHWDPSMQCWRVPEVWAREVARHVEQINGTRKVADEPRASDQRDVVLDLLRFTPERLRDGTYKALARAWHPDTGGDTRLMQALTRAHDLLKKQ